MASKKKARAAHVPNADGVCENCGLELDSASGQAPCAQAPAPAEAEDAAAEGE